MTSPTHAGLVVRGLRLSYSVSRGSALQALDVPEFRVPPGQSVGITGPSGSGKTSLLYALAGLERPQEGSVTWGEVDIVRLPEAARDRWRRGFIGFIFQEFHLVPGLSAMQNVLLPTAFDHLRPPALLRDRALKLLARVGLDGKRVTAEKLSRGEMQRVAVARALIFLPPVVMADEPTASLDAQNGRAVADLLLMLCRELGSTLIVVSHDAALLDRLDTVHRLIAGRFQISQEFSP